LPTLCSFLLAFRLSSCVKSLSFGFLCSEDEDPKRDAAIAPSTENMNADESPVQEGEPTVKSPKARRPPIKKVPVARGNKRSKKSKEADISLEPHESRSSPDDVRGGFSLFIFCFLRDPYAYVLFPWQIMMKKFMTLGTKCAEYLKSAKASEGSLFPFTLLISSTFPCSLSYSSFPIFYYRCLGDG
jgi:hypothetical protein